MFFVVSTLQLYDWHAKSCEVWHVRSCGVKSKRAGTALAVVRGCEDVVVGTLQLYDLRSCEVWGQNEKSEHNISTYSSRGVLNRTHPTYVGVGPRLVLSSLSAS